MTYLEAVAATLGLAVLPTLAYVAYRTATRPRLPIPAPVPAAGRELHHVVDLLIAQAISRQHARVSYRGRDVSIERSPYGWRVLIDGVEVAHPGATELRRSKPEVLTLLRALRPRTGGQ